MSYFLSEMKPLSPVNWYPSTSSVLLHYWLWPQSVSSIGGRVIFISFPAHGALKMIQKSCGQGMQEVSSNPSSFVKEFHCLVFQILQYKDQKQSYPTCPPGPMGMVMKMLYKD